MQILRANLETNTIQYEPVPPSWERLGGRALVARFLLDEVPARCDPLGKQNKLIWAPGLLVGHMLSSCDRISVGGKSPLTNGVKEANAGGTTGLKLVWMGLHALILEGGPPPDECWKILVVDADGARFEDGEDFAGLGLGETAERLIERYGKKIGISAIGPAGERLYRTAT
jgi:aldehyde:ferredoxin oxidoreductase